MSPTNLTNPNPIGEIESLLAEAHEVRVNDLSESIRLGSEALEKARKIDEKDLIGKSLSMLSLFYMITGQNTISLETAREAIDIFEKTGNKKGIADAKYSIAGTFYKTDEFHLGLAELEDCLTIYREIGDYFNQARVQKTMGTIYEYFDDVNSAIQAYENSIECGQKIGDKNLISNAYNPLSGIFLNQGDTESALDMVNESMRMKKETGDVRGLAFALYGRGKVYIKTRDFDQGEKDLLEAIKIHETSGERLGTAMAFRKLGVLYFEKDDWEKANSCAQKGLEIADQYNIALTKSDLYYLIAQIAQKQKDLPRAIEYLRLHTEFKEEILSRRSQKMIKSYEVVNRLNTLEQQAKAEREKALITEKKNEELDTFFHRVCHDLKGPISNMLGLEDLLRDEVGGNQKVLEFLDSCKLQVSRINMILEELVKLTKVNYENEAFERIEFETLVDDCIKSLRSESNFDKVNVHVQIEEDLNYSGPWALVNSIVQNLIENGIRYARIDQQDPFVKINISKDESSLLIRVSDNGRGMKKSAGRNIFEMFYRENREVEGTGLGLYILHRAVEKLGGSVDVSTELKVGSTFSIKLPMVQ